MKKLFLSLVVLVCATVSFTQNTLVATLTHGDEIKVFFGANLSAASVQGGELAFPDEHGNTKSLMF